MNYAYLNPLFMNKSVWYSILDEFGISDEDKRKVSFINVPIDACEISFKGEDNDDLR